MPNVLCVLPNNPGIRLRMHFFQTSGFRKPTNAGESEENDHLESLNIGDSVKKTPRITNIIHIPPKNAGFCCLFFLVKWGPFLRFSEFSSSSGEVRWSPNDPPNRLLKTRLHDENPRALEPCRQATTQAYAAPGANCPPHD